MPKKEKKSRSAREKLGMILDMPLDMIKGYSRMTMIGNESVLIENYNGIIMGMSAGAMNMSKHIIKNATFFNFLTLKV